MDRIDYERKGSRLQLQEGKLDPAPFRLQEGDLVTV